MSIWGPGNDEPRATAVSVEFTAFRIGVRILVIDLHSWTALLGWLCMASESTCVSVNSIKSFDTQLECENWLKFKYTICASKYGLLYKLMRVHKRRQLWNEISSMNSFGSLVIALHFYVVILLLELAKEFTTPLRLALAQKLCSIVLALVHICCFMSSIVLKHQTPGLFTYRTCWFPLISIPSRISQK